METRSKNFTDFSYRRFENGASDEIGTEINKLMTGLNQTLSHPLESYVIMPKQYAFTDFRSVSIYPTAKELLDPRRPYLESILEKGSYRDLNYYLAVHFRLMREDFISPLRTALQEYLQTGYENENFYEEVEIKKAYSRGELFYKLRIKTDIKENFHKQEILRNGNIICIFSDNFKKIHIALIQNFEDELPKGEAFIQTKFKKTKKMFDEALEKAIYFSALESPSFFESYRHVLQCLQVIHKGQLPFEQNIIHADKNIKTPAYLNSNAWVTLSIANSSNLVEVPLSEFSKWPPAKELKLNISQMKALQLSLSHCLAIIQGPPGTGKTHLGLVILQTLLLNRKAWKIDESPVLIVCYTNHALDQFLEEVLEFNSKIVRVGSRSVSEKLAEFNLKHIRKNHPDYVTLLNEITEIRTELENLNLLLKHKSKCIFHENMFDLPYPDRQILNTMKNMNYVRESKSCLGKWLGVAFTTEEIDCSARSYFFNGRVTFKEFDKDKGTEINCLHNMHCHFEFPEELENALLCRLKYPCLKKQKLAVKEMRKTDEMRDDLVEEDMDLFSLSLRDRWRLYRRWVSIFTKKTVFKITELQSKIRNKYNTLKEVSRRIDFEIMKYCDVLGMTTTGAARNYDVLTRIGCRIVIIEEAGEILESHTIACLNPYVQHLILIGDHKQLRPKPQDYHLAKNYHLDVSLFERLVKNDLPYVTLEEQHRMRPEISDLIRDEFYPTMKDHPDVFLYPDIRGVLFNVYFINHFSEEEEVMGNSKTYKNDYEANYLVSICEYLLQQGYTTNDISILTTYNGQLAAITNLIQKNTELASNLRVSTVDNYQGEENDIILLSLVRSNAFGIVGFLKESNRVNVGLSRARHGLFVFGNLEFLAKNCRLWKRIVKKMKSKELFGPSLPIGCRTHINSVRMIAHSQEFEKNAFHFHCRCFKICKKRMPCGHTCQKRHHDSVHVCSYTITRYCKYGHQVIEKCTGMTLNPLTVKENCDQACRNLLKCGHACQKKCHHNVHFCDITTTRYLECGHQIVEKCTGNPSNPFKVKRDCDQACGKMLDCGHNCYLKCHKNSQHLSIHKCGETITRYLSCGEIPPIFYLLLIVFIIVIYLII